LLVVAAGRIEHEQLLDVVAQRPWPKAVSRDSRKMAQRQSGVQYLSRDMEQAQVVASFEGITATSRDRPVAWLANQMLGGGMSSALFREVRERRGLAYSVGSHLSPLSDVGLWSVSCGTPPHMLEQCIACLQETVRAFSGNLDEVSFHRAKRQMEVQFRMAMDSVEGHMLYLGARLDEDTLLSQVKWVEKIKQVTLNEVQSWASEHLASDAMWSIAGSDEALSSAQKVM
jgi:predicted Zn-dependent peptidase